MSPGGGVNHRAVGGGGGGGEKRSREDGVTPHVLFIKTHFPDVIHSSVSVSPTTKL